MSIQDDIDALENSLPLITEQDREDWAEVATPERIRRLLDALRLERDQSCDAISDANVYFIRANDAEAKLSKALELLKEATEEVDPLFREKLDAFLKENGHD